MKRTSALLATLTALALFGCDQPKNVKADANVKLLPTIDVALAGRAFKLEVADEESERETGLMHRTTMPADHGMLFVFPDVKNRSFWMKNTLIPLEIAYLTPDGTVTDVLPMMPQDLRSVPSSAPAKYAIEVNGGIATQIGLKPGDHVTLPVIDAK